MAGRPIEVVNIWELMERASRVRAMDQDFEERKLQMQEREIARKRREENEQARADLLASDDPETKRRAEIQLMAFDTEALANIQGLAEREQISNRENAKFRQKNAQERARIMARGLYNASQNGTVDPKAISSMMAAMADRAGGDPEEQAYVQKVQQALVPIMQLDPKDPQQAEQQRQALEGLQDQYEFQLEEVERPKVIARDQFASSWVHQHTHNPIYLGQPQLAARDHGELYVQGLGEYDKLQFAKAASRGITINNNMPTTPDETGAAAKNEAEKELKGEQESGETARYLLRLLRSPEGRAVQGAWGQLKVYFGRKVEGLTGGQIKIGQQYVRTQQIFETVGGKYILDILRRQSGATVSDKERLAMYQVVGNMDAMHPAALETALMAMAEMSDRKVRAASGFVAAPIDPTFMLTDEQTQFVDAISRKAIDRYRAKQIDEVSMRNEIGKAAIVMGRMINENRLKLDGIAELEFEKQNLKDTNPARVREIDLILSKLPKVVQDLRLKQQQAIRQDIQTRKTDLRGALGM